MKKILLSAIMLTALSFASFADEMVKEKIEVKTEIQNIPILPDPPCVAGMTSCGIGYMYCGDDIGGNTEIDLWMWEDFVLCEL